MEITPIIQLVFWCFILVASCYYFGALITHAYKRRRYIRRQAEKTLAIIIDYKEETDGDGIKYYIPLLKFRDKNGNTHVVEDESGKYYKCKPGKQLAIYYLPQDPNQFYIPGSVPFEVFLLPFGLVAISLTVFAIIKTISFL